MSTRKRTPKFLQADVERGLILAYYELVRGCEVSLDQSYKNIVPVVALAYKPGELCGMDFSSIYHFTENEKPSTRLRRVRTKIESLRKYADFMEAQDKLECRAVYEIWCFIPPNKFVTDTFAKAVEENMPVELLGTEMVGVRIRQVAILEPLDQEAVDDNAFLWAASLFRQAGAWK